MAQNLELIDALARFEFLLFDTCVLISAFKAMKAGRAWDFPGKVPRPNRATSLISVTEFLRGADLSREERRGRGDWLDEQGIRRFDFDLKASRTLRSQLNANSKPRKLGDSLIAAHAVAHGIPLLTEDVEDYLPVADLFIVSARIPSTDRDGPAASS